MKAASARALLVLVTGLAALAAILAAGAPRSQDSVSSGMLKPLHPPGSAFAAACGGGMFRCVSRRSQRPAPLRCVDGGAANAGAGDQESMPLLSALQEARNKVQVPFFFPGHQMGRGAPPVLPATSPDARNAKHIMHPPRRRRTRQMHKTSDPYACV